MTMPFYSSVDQLLRDRSELARKGIARGRSVVVLTYTGGVLFVAENRSTALHKVSEIYDRIGFAAVGRYNEFDNLRTAGIRHADLRGYTYDRRDVTGRGLANGYAQLLGTAFVEQQKPYEVELCLAEVGTDPGSDQLYRITYDGSITDEPQFVVMGGTTEPISAKLRETYRSGLELKEAIGIAVEALQAASSGNGGTHEVLGVGTLEVAVLDRTRQRRTFRRITGNVLRDLLPEANRAVSGARGAEAGGDDVPAGSGAVNGDAGS
ncbi:proteasome alpha subunit [Pseudonocardia hierapolitana]|uniref:Proteasome subunit alpha n=1 Tax=Pseudonocardia hierapolitana TaxID=1128676 RepID=A0A561T348_9PSEU|nr:proteasome subunit alpha [Pseudonocardia hierapolitana]TWF81531.1 proteasome alpha subunit [Pseudonocardia hierapolitana]